MQEQEYCVNVCVRAGTGILCECVCVCVQEQGYCECVCV